MVVPEKKKAGQDYEAGDPSNTKVSSTKLLQHAHHHKEEMEKEGVEQGELYSPAHAINFNGNRDYGVLLAVMLIKVKVLEKLLQAAPEVSVDRARLFLDTATKSGGPVNFSPSYEDAVNSIKTRLAVILPQALAFQIVDMAADEVRQILKRPQDMSQSHQTNNRGHHDHTTGKPTSNPHSTSRL